MTSRSPSCLHIWVPGIREGTGGIQNFCRNLVRMLHESFPHLALRIIVKNDSLSPNDPLREYGTFTSVEDVPARLRTPALVVLGTTYALKELPVAILGAHLHFLPALKIIRSLTGVPYCGFLYGIEAWDIRLKHRILAMRSANKLIAISRFTRDRIISDYDVSADRIQVVPCTFDWGLFSIGPKPPELLARYGLKPENKVLLTVSRLAMSERYKGHRQVLFALKKICEGHPEVRYLIAGDGDDLPRLQEMVKAMNLTEQVIFGGYVPVKDLPGLYRLCDLFIMPSTKEGFGIVFLEAMTSGKPTLGGNIDGSVDALDDGRLGALVDPNDSNEIANTVCQILDQTYPNPLLYHPEGLREAVIARFGFAKIKEEMTSALRPLIEMSKSSRLEDLDCPNLDQDVIGLGKPRLPQITLLTQLTSPYQVEFFNAIASSGECNLEVIYLTSRDVSRNWDTPTPTHNHVILGDSPKMKQSALRALERSDLTIFNYYTHPFALKAIRQRARSGKPWVFWGERPGFYHLGVLGECIRKVLLAPLHKKNLPIWGVGRFGVEGYQNEFGKKRPYANLSYYSNLERFENHPKAEHQGGLRFLFSGSLTHRKGVDLLAQSFRAVSSKYPDARLLVMGSGELRRKMETHFGPALSKVEWIGFQPWDKLPEFYAKADVFCFPSRYDGWGLALVEALASGLPVISTDQTGSALEFIKHEENGWLIPAGNEAALTNAMVSALEMSDAQRMEMSNKARSSVSKHSLKDGCTTFIDSAMNALTGVFDG